MKYEKLKGKQTAFNATNIYKNINELTKITAEKISRTAVRAIGKQEKGREKLTPPHVVVWPREEENCNDSNNAKTLAVFISSFQLQE